MTAIEDARAALAEGRNDHTYRDLQRILRAVIAEHEGFLRHRAEAINADLMRTLTLIFMDREIGERAREIYLESTGDIAPPTDDEREALRLLIHRAMVTTGLGFAVAKLADYEQQTYDAILDRSADTILAAGFRRQGPITDARVEAALDAYAAALGGSPRSLESFKAATRDRMRAALEAARDTP